MAVAFEDFGTMVGGAGVSSIAVPFTGNESVNDILILQIVGWGTSISYTTPDGWNTLSSVLSSDSPATFWRRCDGNETGTVTVEFSGAQNVAAQMSRWSGCITTGTPYESLTSSGLVTDNKFDIPSIDTLGDNRLAVSFIERFQVITEGVPTDYTQEFDNNSGTYQSQCFGYSQFIASASTVAADTFTASSSGNYHITTFAFIPAVTGAISGTSSITFSESATIEKMMFISGSSSISFSEQSQLKGINYIQGNTSMDFQSSGSIYDILGMISEIISFDSEIKNLISFKSKIRTVVEFDSEIRNLIEFNSKI